MHTVKFKLKGTNNNCLGSQTSFLYTYKDLFKKHYKDLQIHLWL
jgi:hypothetical protein